MNEQTLERMLRKGKTRKMTKKRHHEEGASARDVVLVSLFHNWLSLYKSSLKIFESVSIP